MFCENAGIIIIFSRKGVLCFSSWVPTEYKASLCNVKVRSIFGLSELNTFTVRMNSHQEIWAVLSQNVRKELFSWRGRFLIVTEPSWILVQHYNHRVKGSTHMTFDAACWFEQRPVLYPFSKWCLNKEMGKETGLVSRCVLQPKHSSTNNKFKPKSNPKLI